MRSGPDLAGQPNLDSLSVTQLKALCKKRGISGYSKLNKAAILQKLRSHDGPFPAPSAMDRAPRKSLGSKTVSQGMGLEVTVTRLNATMSLRGETGITLTEEVQGSVANKDFLNNEGQLPFFSANVGQR